MPFALMMVAGAMLFGGVAVLDEAKKQMARRDARHRQEFEAELLAGEIKLETLREEARRHGIDPDVVQAGYEAVQSGALDLDDVIRALGTGR